MLRRPTLLQAQALFESSQIACTFVTAEGPPTQVLCREFRQAAYHYAAVWQQLGVGSQTLVAIIDTQSLNSMYAFWGALLIGAIPTMLPPLTEKLDKGIYQEQIRWLVRHSNVAAIMTDDALAAPLRRYVTCPVYSWAEVVETAVVSGSVIPYHSQPDDIAFLQHSSGTTGLQKGVALSHRAVLNQLHHYSEAIALTEGDVVVSWLPLYHDMGLIAGFLLPLVLGVPLVLMSPLAWVRQPALLLRAISDYKGTLCWLPNFAYNHCVRRIRPQQLEGVSLASMRLFVNCSEPVQPASHADFLARFGAYGVRPEMLAVSYAMAENTFAVTQTVPTQPPTVDVVDGVLLQQQGVAQSVASTVPNGVAIASCGKAIAGTEVRVVGTNGCFLPDRRVGELVIRSDCMLREYYKRPDIRPFVDGWYQTGDLGYMVAGVVYVNGRVKDLIIHAGKNVYPQDIEAIVNGVAGVRAGRAVVFGVPDAREGTELIVVVVETASEDKGERQQLKTAVRQAIAQQSMVTANYVTLVPPKWLIKTSSGKLARAANRDKWLYECF